MALTTNTVSQSGSVRNHAIGQVVTDSGTAAVTTFTVGFTPRYVKFVNLTDRIVDEWYEGMAADSSLHTVAAGTITLATSGGITVGKNSFTVPAALIPASKTLTYQVSA